MRDPEEAEALRDELMRQTLVDFDPDHASPERLREVVRQIEQRGEDATEHDPPPP